MATKKITINELRNIVKQIIKELDTNTYANLMDKTESFPWAQFMGPDSKDKYTNPKHRWNKLARVNGKARERFEAEFYKEFPKNSVSTKILTNLGEFNFYGIKFNTNYTSYNLMFTQENKNTNWPKYLWIKPEKNGYYIEDSSIKIADANSDKLINQMLKYNLIKK